MDYCITVFKSTTLDGPPATDTFTWEVSPYSYKH